MAESTATAPDSQDTLWTARVQFLNSTTKPVKLVKLGENERGKFARIEFADEVVRPVYLPTMEDAWHPLFDPLTWEERWEIRCHQNPFEPQPLADGNVKHREYLSFQSVTQTRRGKHICSCDFDVPEQVYSDGRITGLKAAKEYMAALAITNFNRISLKDVIEELAKSIGHGQSEQSRRGAAIGFVHGLESMLSLAAKTSDHQQYFQSLIQQQEHESAVIRQSVAQRQHQRKAEFVERMRIAKAAKRQPNAFTAAEIEHA